MTVAEKLIHDIRVSCCEQKCLIKHCNIVRIILPYNMYCLLQQEWESKIQYKEEFTGIRTFMGIPIEPDDKVYKIQYVIEGDLELV